MVRNQVNCYTYPNLITLAAPCHGEVCWECRPHTVGPKRRTPLCCVGPRTRVHSVLLTGRVECGGRVAWVVSAGFTKMPYSGVQYVSLGLE